MKKIENFEWNDLVLYSKGWYENYATNEEEFFQEIEKVIKLNDNRSYYKNMSRGDIMRMLFNAHTQICNNLEEYERTSQHWSATPQTFYTNVSNFIRRAKMYYNQEVSMDYAAARVIISTMSELTREQCELKKPVYGKGRLRIGSMFGNPRPISLTYRQMNREASKIFDK